MGAGETSFLADAEEGHSEGSTAPESSSAGTAAYGAPPTTLHEKPVTCDFGPELCGTLLGECADDETRQFTFTTDTATGEVVAEGSYCPTTPEDGEPIRLTAGMVARAFQRIPVPAPDLVIQPPDGKTLVNFETNFYTEERTFDRTVRLLGNRVELRIWVDTYRWDFGDGTTRETAGPGAAYPALLITHNYTRKGTYRPSLEVVYAADFRVNGGPWRPVAGTVTRADSPTSLRAIEATPTLVGYDG